VYDTFGRLQRMTYPDGEVLTYGYDTGGLVNSATGVKGKFTYRYLKRLDYDKFDQRVYLQLGNGVTTNYDYRLDNRRLDTLQAHLPNVTHYRFQNLGYGYDKVGNILELSNNTIYPEGQKGIGEEVGGPVTQSYVYDDLYRLKEANGEYRHNATDLRRYRMSMDYDNIHNIVAKEQLDEEVEQEDGKTETEVEHETSYTYGYHYAAPQTGSNAGSIHPHAPSEIGHYSFQYDANGNQLERRYRDDDNTRQIVWDEDNRMACVHEFEHEHPQSIIAQIPVNCSSTAEKLNHDDRNIQNGSHTPEVRFVYNDRGERVFKESDDNVSFYLNPHYTEKSDDAFKHILIGTTRLVTKEMNSEKTKELEHEQYYYHPDHLGSSAYVTDHEGKLKEHLEYFPFGETWIQEENSLEIAFRFTAKELDGETGLYYFGARYYDPRTSGWASADPILGNYLDGAAGGIYQSSNLALYSYARNNPVALKDGDGNIVPLIIGAIILADKAIAAYDTYQTAKAVASGETSLSDLAANKATDVVLRKVIPGGSIIGKIVDKVQDKLHTNHMPCSFAPETQVMTKEGYKSIASIKAGDYVLSRDEKTGVQDWKKVVMAYNSLHDDALTVAFEETQGEKTNPLVTTGEHPFYLKDKGWTSANELKAGDLVVTSSGNLLKIKSATWLQGKQIAYNMEVEDFHTYFVGEEQVWVHNACDSADKTLSLSKTGGHHPVPKFMGGDKLQWLETALTKEQHVEFHKDLALNLKKHGFPDARNTSTSTWDKLLKQDGAQQKAYDTLLDTARDFDQKHGTNLVHDVWKNVAEGRMRGID
jgi:RHS repeat-associated protein